MKIQDAAMVIEEQPAKVAEALKLFLQVSPLQKHEFVFGSDYRYHFSFVVVRLAFPGSRAHISLEKEAAATSEECRAGKRKGSE